MKNAEQRVFLERLNRMNNVRCINRKEIFQKHVYSGLVGISSLTKVIFYEYLFNEYNKFFENRNYVRAAVNF